MKRTLTQSDLNNNTVESKPVRFRNRVFALAACLMLAGAPVLTTTGCANKAQTGALIGAGAGAVGGYIIGNELDKDDYRHHHHHYRR